MPFDHPPVTSSPVLYRQRVRTYRPATVVEAGAAGAVFGWLLGRHHHPLVWAGLLFFVLSLMAVVIFLW